MNPKIVQKCEELMDLKWTKKEPKVVWKSNDVML